MRWVGSRDVSRRWVPGVSTGPLGLAVSGSLGTSMMARIRKCQLVRVLPGTSVAFATVAGSAWCRSCGANVVLCTSRWSCNWLAWIDSWGDSIKFESGFDVNHWLLDGNGSIVLGYGSSNFSYFHNFTIMSWVAWHTEGVMSSWNHIWFLVTFRFFPQNPTIFEPFLILRFSKFSWENVLFPVAPLAP